MAESIMWQTMNICQQGKTRCQLNRREELKNVDYFKYLGSVIDKYSTIDIDVDLRVRAAWSS